MICYEFPENRSINNILIGTKKPKELKLAGGLTMHGNYDIVLGIAWSSMNILKMSKDQHENGPTIESIDGLSRQGY